MVVSEQRLSCGCSSCNGRASMCSADSIAAVLHDICDGLVRLLPLHRRFGRADGLLINRAKTVLVKYSPQIDVALNDRISATLHGASLEVRSVWIYLCFPLGLGSIAHWWGVAQAKFRAGCIHIRGQVFRPKDRRAAYVALAFWCSGIGPQHC